MKLVVVVNQTFSPTYGFEVHFLASHPRRFNHVPGLFVEGTGGGAPFFEALLSQLSRIHMVSSLWTHFAKSTLVGCFVLVHLYI